MEKSEIARLVNWAKEQKLGIGEMPSVHVLQTIQWVKVRHKGGERRDVDMDSEEEEPSAVGSCVLRNNGAKYKPYSAVSDGSEI